MQRTLNTVGMRIIGLLLLVVTVSTVLAEEPLQVAFIYPQAPSNAVLNTYDYSIAGEAGRRGAELANEQFGWVAQQQGIDFRVDVPALEVPYVMVIGEHEARGRAVLAEEWFDQVEAPAKERVVFEGGGHRPNFDDPARFAEVLASVASRFGG